MNVSRQAYLQAVHSFTERISTTERFQERVIALYLAGSVARGDFVPGRSDIDLYAVVSSHDPALEEALTKLADQTAKAYLKDLFSTHVSPITVALTTFSDVVSGKSFLGAGFEYENFQRTGKLLYGSDVKSQIPRPDPEDAIAMGKDALAGATSIVTSAEMPSGYFAELCGRVFSTLFRSTAILLNCLGIRVAGKLEVVHAFKRSYSQEVDLCSMLEEAYELYAVWGARDLNDMEFARVATICRKVVPSLRPLLHKEVELGNSS